MFAEKDRPIKPAGATQVSNDVDAPPLKDGCYDAGDGYYDPKTGNVHDKKTDDVLRKARADEAAWLQRKARFGTGAAEVTSHRASLESR